MSEILHYLFLRWTRKKVSARVTFWYFAENSGGYAVVPHVVLPHGLPDHLVANIIQAMWSVERGEDAVVWIDEVMPNEDVRV